MSSRGPPLRCRSAECEVTPNRSSRSLVRTCHWIRPEGTVDDTSRCSSHCGASVCDGDRTLACHGVRGGLMAGSSPASLVMTRGRLSSAWRHDPAGLGTWPRGSDELRNWGRGLLPPRQRLRPCQPPSVTQGTQGIGCVTREALACPLLNIGECVRCCTGCALRA
jgi:hypothetical protein